jgi:hypothetical protein
MKKRNTKEKLSWRRVPDARIRHRWDVDCGCELVERSVYVPPTFYGDSGTPICEECGTDRKYVGTEIEMSSQKPITITVEGGVIQAIQHIPKGMTVKVLDFDVDGVPDEDLTKLRNGQKAVVAEWGGRQ